MIEPLPGDIAPIDVLLRRSAREFVYPPTRSIAPGVMARVREQAAAPRGLPAWRPAFRFAAAAAAVMLAITGAALAIPESRGALADFFGLSHVRVEVGPTAGPTPPALSPESFARPSSIGEAQQLVDFTLRFPTREGARLDPDAVYLAHEDSTAILVYEDEGYDLYQSEGSYFGKGLPEPGSFEQLEFDGKPAYWFHEGGHIARFEDEQGRIVVESERTVERGTLLWEEDGVTYRLETSLSQDEAIEVARSVR